LAKSTAAENSATKVNFATISAYTFIIFINRTSTYPTTFTHHREGRLGAGLGLV